METINDNNKQKTRSGRITSSQAEMEINSVYKANNSMHTVSTKFRRNAFFNQISP